jgi:hypothetical protein
MQSRNARGGGGREGTTATATNRGRGKERTAGRGFHNRGFEVSGRWQRARGNAELGEGDVVELGELKRSSGGEGMRTGKSRLA